jgi:hypothetical protein
LGERGNGVAKPVEAARLGFRSAVIGKPGGKNSLFFFFKQFSPRTTSGAVNLFRTDGARTPG